MNIQAGAEYCEQLCREHKLLRHSEAAPHFVNLNDDKRNMGLAQELRYPAVYFESTDFTLSISSVSVRREYTCHIEVFEHVADTGDYAEVERALSSAERILTDIFARMMHDRARRAADQRWLLNVSSPSMIKVVPLQNEHNALYGYTAELKVPIPGCITDNINNFISSSNG